jgi:hypothetical protein
MHHLFLDEISAQKLSSTSGSSLAREEKTKIYWEKQ